MERRKYFYVFIADWLEYDHIVIYRPSLIHRCDTTAPLLLMIEVVVSVDRSRMLTGDRSGGRSSVIASDRRFRRLETESTKHNWRCHTHRCCLQRSGQLASCCYGCWCCILLGSCQASQSSLQLGLSYWIDECARVLSRIDAARWVSSRNWHQRRQCRSSRRDQFRSNVEANGTYIIAFLILNSWRVAPSTG